MMEAADTDTLEFDGKKVRDAESGKEVSLVDIATASMCNNNETFPGDRDKQFSSIPTTIYGRNG